MKNAWQLDPFYFAPERKLDGSWRCSKDSPAQPPAPDYGGAARATSAGTVQASIANNVMAHPNIYTPLGSQIWSQNGSYQVPGAEGNTPVDVPTYSQQINLTPQGQGLYDQQMRMSKSYGDIGEAGLNRIETAFNKPLDESSIKDLQNSAYSAETDRLNPQWAAAGVSNDAKLANQGITQGSEAYDNAMRTFNQGKNDAYQQARLSAASMAPQLLQQKLAIRNQPLSEVNALRTGAQPQMPTFQPSQYSLGAQGPNMLGATQAQGQYGQGLYNSQVGQQNSMMSGLFGLGGAVAPFMFG